MKWFYGAVLLLIVAGALSGCSGGKEAPVVNNSTPQATADRVKQIQNDPSMPANEKQAIIGALQGPQSGASSHAPAGVSVAK
jgi:hypothetical protein